MHDVAITWESADSTLKEALYDFSSCYGKPVLPYGKRIIIPMDGDLSPFVFGDDILDNDGLICIQKLTKSDFVPYCKDTIIINTSRVFSDPDHVELDDYYKPCVSVKNDANRNITDDLISGYRIEVSPFGDCVDMYDVIDQIKFK